MVTVMSTVPVPTGEAAVIEVALLNVKLAGAVPKYTAVAPVKLVPVIVIAVPPAAGPEFGATPVTVGAGATGVVPVSENCCTAPAWFSALSASQSHPPNVPEAVELKSTTMVQFAPAGRLYGAGPQVEETS